LQYFVRGRDFVNDAQKAKPFLMPVTVAAHGNHCAIESIECRKQGRCSIPLVVVGHSSAAPLVQRQAGLRPIQGLNLAFLIGEKYDGGFK